MIQYIYIKKGGSSVKSIILFFVLSLNFTILLNYPISITTILTEETPYADLPGHHSESPNHNSSL